MQRLSARAGPVRLALIGLLIAAIAIPAIAQPDPATSPTVHVDSVEMNLTLQPSFNFVVQVPTMLRFESFEYHGQRLLHVWAYSADSLNVRIRKAAAYLSTKPGIFTPLFDNPPNKPILGYLDRASFEQALRDLLPARRLSYNRRLI